MQTAKKVESPIAERMKHQPIDSESAPTKVQPYRHITVLGAGGWGTALAAVARNAGAEVTLWGRDPAVTQAVAETAANPRYLDGIRLPDGIRATTDLRASVQSADAVIVVVPSGAIRQICRDISPALPAGVPVAICAKGIEGGTGLLMTQVARDELGPRPVGVISGPTFAREVALGYPTAATVSFEFEYADRLKPTESPAARLSVSMTTQSFRTYLSDDVIGVEIGGAMKNVVAIACGMMTGAGFAENTRAALITRGLDEMKQVAEALGGRRETVTGLAGVGDLTLTCSSPTSRNMSLGIQLGEGKSRDACFEGRPVVVEGENNSVTVTDLARRLNLHLPICEAVRAILHDGADLTRTFAGLWAAPIEAEPRTMQLRLDHPLESGAVTGLAERAE